VHRSPFGGNSAPGREGVGREEITGCSLSVLIAYHRGCKEAGPEIKTREEEDDCPAEG